MSQMQLATDGTERLVERKTVLEGMGMGGVFKMACQTALLSCAHPLATHRPPKGPALSIRGNHAEQVLTATPSKPQCPEPVAQLPRACSWPVRPARTPSKLLYR
jgi:hypothetical protein